MGRPITNGNLAINWISTTCFSLSTIKLHAVTNLDSKLVTRGIRTCYLWITNTTLCYPKIAGSNPASSEVVKVAKVVPKIEFFEGRFGFLRSQGFQKYEYHFCCQYFAWADTGANCDK